MKKHANEDGWILAAAVAVILLLIIAGLYLKFGNQAQVVNVQGGKCTCSDIPDMRNRMTEVNAAIAEYRLAIQDVQNHDGETGTITRYNEDTFNEEEVNVQNAVKGAHTPGTHSGSGKTGTDCGTTVDAPTACLKGSFQVHENLHAANCQRIKAQRQLSWNANYRDTMTMVDYWNEEINAYSAELPYLSQEIGNAIKDPACQWTCDIDGKTYSDHSVCEANCRPTLGSNIKTGFRCTQAKGK